MALDKRHSISTFFTKILWIFFLVFQESNLVICYDLEDDSLKNALEAIENRQRDLQFQENEYYGQPENIGYGFQKTLGFFDNTGPATELGSFDSDPKNDNELQNLFLNYGNYKKESDYDNGLDKRMSNFRERLSGPRSRYLVSEKDSGEYPQNSVEYLQLLKNLWSKYRQAQGEDLNIEDLTDDQVEEILDLLYGKENNEIRLGNDYGNSESNSYEQQFDVFPVRDRKNYRIFENFGDRRKRYPSFGEGFYGKRNRHSQNINYENPSENDFWYSLKYVNPELNREAVENLREEGFEVLGDEKDRDIIRILSNGMNRPRYEEKDESFWLNRGQNQNNYEDGVWLDEPVRLSGNVYEELGRGEKRNEPSPRFFKQHNGIHLNAKRFPVKRSPPRVRKEVQNEKVSEELKGIFATPETTTIPPKKVTEKKPTMEGVKKQNVTKPEVTKHHETKKVVRRADKHTKERIFAGNANKEIEDIFNVRKKSIDWSQYFGLDKRSTQNWLKNDYLSRSEGRFLAPKSKRLSFDRANVGNVNFLDRSQYEMPFDTRLFNKKGYNYDVGSNIEKVENRIGDIEEKIIDDAVKYTGANSGNGNGDLSKVKNKVIQDLEAAYSLEKMKNVLKEFKDLIAPEKSVVIKEISKKTSTEPPKAETRTSVPKENVNLEKPISDKKPVGETNKRVATKKEGVKSIFGDNFPGSLEFLNDGSLMTRQYENEACPVLDKVQHNCFRIEEMSGRFGEVLIPLCTLQQVCYFCGPEIGFSKMSMCDAVYLSEAQNICQGNSECLISARGSMLALQDLYEQEVMNENSPHFLSGSCLSNPCLQRYFLNSPGAIYPLEVQN